jgi:hypothetical protein
LISASIQHRSSRGGVRVRLRPSVIEQLGVHGVAPDAEPAELRARLNDIYLEEVRRLRERQRAGAIPLREYAQHVESLKRKFPLLSLPLEMWSA